MYWLLHLFFGLVKGSIVKNVSVLSGKWFGIWITSVLSCICVISVLRRLFSLNILSTVYFADIILADILTSFSNVFGDLFTTGCSALGNPSDDPDACHRDILVPLLIR